MTDTLTPSQRHLNMSRIRSKNTKPELLVRKWLWQHGFHYRLNVKDIPGKPDIVLRKHKTVIFINGCFWHGHDGCDKFVMPKSNVEFWENKIRTNKERDEKNHRILRETGWKVIVIWECQLKAADIEETMREVVESLRHTGEGNKRDEVRTRLSQETPWYDVSTSTQMVAEPTPEYKAEKNRENGQRKKQVIKPTDTEA